MNALLAVTLALFLSAGPAREDDEPADVSIKVEKGHIDFLVGKDLVTRYHVGPDVPKPYFWPVRGPGGVNLTRAYPMEKVPGETTDHVHQKSAWFCHGDVIPEGLEQKHKIQGVEGVDFWAESKGHGRIVCTRVDPPAVEKRIGKVVTHNEWRTADGQKVLDEKRTLSLYNLGKARLLVLDADLHASVVPVTFGDTKEGSFGVRVNDRLREQAGGKLTNADGESGAKAVWGQRSDWCDYSGTLDDRKVGLAILDDPANPYRACWHSRDYGLMAANPFGRTKSGFPAVRDAKELVRLAKGEHLKLRYGLLLHSGDAKEGQVEDYYQLFTRSIPNLR